MAIDTETKRRSALGHALGVARVLPVADGSVAAGDRAHVLGLYGGLDFLVPPLTGKSPFLVAVQPAGHAAIITIAGTRIQVDS